MKVQRADVEQPAIISEGAVGVDLQDHLRQAVIGRSAMVAACGVAQGFAGFLNGQRRPVLTE